MKVFPGISPERLDGILQRFPQSRIAVVGDFFLDKYLEVDPHLQEISLKRASPHQVVRVRHSPGAAGTVVCNLAALEAGEVIPVGFTWRRRRRIRTAAGVGLAGMPSIIFTRSRPFAPPLILSRGYYRSQPCRGTFAHDMKNRAGIPPELQQRILGSLRMLLDQGIQAVIVADQVEESFHGVITLGCGSS